MGGRPGNHGAVVGGHRGERGAVMESMGPSWEAVVVRGRVDYKPPMLYSLMNTKKQNKKSPASSESSFVKIGTDGWFNGWTCVFILNSGKM